ncbi:hypothetical protein AOQ84DRAFT_425716, partial [Glonium stellatum]
MTGPRRAHFPVGLSVALYPSLIETAVFPTTSLPAIAPPNNTSSITRAALWAGQQPSDEPHDRNVHETYTTSLQQRQQQAQAVYRELYNHSRVSSSSGSVPYTLRRTPNFEDPRPRPRSASFEPAPQRSQPTVRFADDQRRPGESSTSPRVTSQSQPQNAFAPHPALRISRRTASAILYALEEAIRTPYTFTPDLAEENASMSDLAGGPSGNGRAANGGARTAPGPVPVSQAPPSGIRTPQMIMNQRRERDARRAAEADAARVAEEQQRRAQEEERRKSAERRAQAAGVAGQSRDPGYQRPTQAAPTRAPGDSGYGYIGGGGPSREPERTAASRPLREPERAAAITGGPVNPPTGAQQPEASTGTPYSRPRATSQSQQQPRPVPASQTTPTRTADTQRAQGSQSHARQPSTSAGPSQARAGPSAAPQPSQSMPGPSSSAGGHSRNPTTSSFPHAFERWETLSSHWEGLTSYWIRRLEQNTEEVRREPLAQQMSRQITDLSAAGANLFHAVVELQRLRASSERKFQRWFYEHRQEQERAQEIQAELEHTLQVERQARADAVANAERLATEKKNSDRTVAEMRRELQISKEEARRAWEELGRREQEERDRQFSLREGQPTLVGGVQVVPLTGTANRHGSVSQRPSTRDEGYQTGPSGSQAVGGPSLDQGYSYEGSQSPTGTDPFTEGVHQPLRHEPDVSSLPHGTYAPFPPGSDPGASSSTARTAIPSQASQQPAQIPAPLYPHRGASQQPPTQPTTSRPEAFYQQPGSYLHNEPTPGLPEDEQSYVASQGDTSDGDEEYEIDQYGNFVLDNQGRRVPYRAAHMHGSESSEGDVRSALERERE